MAARPKLRAVAPPAPPVALDGVSLDEVQVFRLARLIHCVWHADHTLDAASTIDRACGALRASMRLDRSAWVDLPSMPLPGGRRMRLSPDAG